jgi:DNA-binding response OmpR family regulator
MTSSIVKNFFKECITASNGQDGIDRYIEYYKENNKHIDIVISDMMMPKKNGISLAKEILELNAEQMIIIISANNDSDNLIELINTKVNHFLSKPFDTNMLLDCLRVCCKELKQSDNNTVNLRDNFIWDKELKILKQNEDTIKLTKNEITILDLLLNNLDRTFSDKNIFIAINGKGTTKDLSIDSVKSIIKRLRKKLPPETIENVYGDGYKISTIKN